MAHRISARRAKLIDEYHIYIDEAGDEGFGKLKDSTPNGQSHWLMLGAIIVSKENDKHLPRWRDDILKMFPHQRRRDLHFNKLKHDQKVATCDFLSDKKFGACVVCSDKKQILDLSPEKYAKYKEKQHLYNYLVRLLLERISKACFDKSKKMSRKAKVFVTFSKRGGTDYQAMRDYLFLLRDGKEKLMPRRSIDWRALNPEDIMVENHSKRAGLQLADVVTSATFKAFEPNSYGFVEPRYGICLRKRFIRENNKVFNGGLKIVPNSHDLLADSQKFLRELE